MANCPRFFSPPQGLSLGPILICLRQAGEWMDAKDRLGKGGIEARTLAKAASL